MLVGPIPESEKLETSVLSHIISHNTSFNLD
jgi:hypothetical protein